MNKKYLLRNKSHKELFEDTNRFVISYGGAGSGKSYSVAQKILQERIIREPNHKYLITRKVARTLRVSVFQLFKDLIHDMGIEHKFKINKADMTITHIPNNSQLIFFGLDDIEKLKSIVGITGIWVEEASECDKQDIMELNRRLRGHTDYYKQILITFNPISHLHWLKEHFFDNEASNASIYHSTYKDNAFIDDEYIKEIELIKEYDIQQYNIYALGEWGVLNSNIVYHNFIHSKHSTALTIEDFEELHIGIDFNVGGCSCVVSGIKNDVVYVVDFHAPYDTDAIVIEFQKQKYRNKDIFMYPDATGIKRTSNASRSDIQILKEGGFKIVAPSGNGPIRDRINSVNRMFAQDRIYVNHNLTKVSYALQTQAYDDSGTPEKYNEHSGGSIDDINDSFGYFIVRKFGITNVKTSISNHNWV